MQMVQNNNGTHAVFKYVEYCMCEIQDTSVNVERTCDTSL